ncbi:hypothetical protein YC2023_030418 [Brassica napus]
MGFRRSIKIKRIIEEIWFQEGWSEFAEAHSLVKAKFASSNTKETRNEVTDEGFLGTQGTRGNDQYVNGGDSEYNLKKRPRDDEF